MSNIEVDKYFCKVEFVDLQGAVFFFVDKFCWVRYNSEKGSVSSNHDNFNFNQQNLISYTNLSEKKQLTQKQMNHLII